MARLVLNADKIASEIKKRNAKRVLVQAPSGLKRKIMEIVPKLEKDTNAKIFFSADSCFGACDIPLGIIESVKPELVLHIGHSKMLNTKKVVYIPLSYEFTAFEKRRILNLMAKELKKRGLIKVSGVATIQYVGLLRWLAKEAKKVGLSIVVKKSRHGIKGQVLGCETSAADAGTKAVVFLGDGLFHAIGIAEQNSKDVLAINPLSCKVQWLYSKELHEMQKRRNALLFKAHQARSFGIVLSAKPGQYNEKLAFEAKKILEDNGKSATIIVADNITEQALLDFGLECYVIIACPRLADDLLNWKLPAISFEDLLLLSGKKGKAIQ